MTTAFAFDIDGTLTHRHDWIDPRVKEKLRSLVEQGYPVALVTGRVFSYANLVLRHLDFPYLLAVQNGADLIEMPSKKPLRRHYLDGSIVAEIDRAYEGQEEDFIIYSGIDRGDFCFYRPNRFSKKMQKYLDILKTLGAAPWQESDFHFEKEAFPLIKCFGSHENMAKLQKQLKQNPHIETSMIHDPIEPSQYLNMITHPKAHKGSVIQYLRSHFNATTFVAAGDDYNDLNMLKEADIAIAIESAPADLLAIADIKAKRPKECGIVEAIEEALNRAS